VRRIALHSSSGVECGLHRLLGYETGNQKQILEIAHYKEASIHSYNLVVFIEMAVAILNLMDEVVVGIAFYTLLKGYDALLFTSSKLLFNRIYCGHYVCNTNPLFLLQQGLQKVEKDEKDQLAFLNVVSYF